MPEGADTAVTTAAGAVTQGLGCTLDCALSVHSASELESLPVIHCLNGFVFVNVLPACPMVVCHKQSYSLRICGVDLT